MPVSFSRNLGSGAKAPNLCGSECGRGGGGDSQSFLMACPLFPNGFRSYRDEGDGMENRFSHLSIPYQAAGAAAAAVWRPFEEDADGL